MPDGIDAKNAEAHITSRLLGSANPVADDNLSHASSSAPVDILTERFVCHDALECAKSAVARVCILAQRFRMVCFMQKYPEEEFNIGSWVCLDCRDMGPDCKRQNPPHHGHVAWLGQVRLVDALQKLLILSSQR